MVALIILSTYIIIIDKWFFLKHFYRFLITKIFLFDDLDEIDFWIEGFLRLTKNNLEKTKTAVDSHFRLKTLFPQVYDVRDLPNYVESDLFEYL